MKPVLFFAAGIAVGLWASLVTAQAPRSTAILNTPGVYVELLTLVPGDGSGQHSILPGEVGLVAEGEVVLSSPNGRESLQAGKAFWLPGLTPHDIRNESNRPAKVYVVAMKRCD
ncbi:MAG TPA: cupin domain-containing protein [Gemmatimonadaceae bacterium]|nr:cupin domain-containing protein [Gemmatimonadaceae bacterium]